MVILGLVGAIIWVVFPKGQKSSSLSNSLLPVSKQVEPSETSIDYSDPSGFTFSYPDNLSITKKETDTNTYADLQLFSKEVNGNLSLKIYDSKFKTLETWVKANQDATVGEPKEVKLGNIKAIEIKTADRLLLGALDQGIFFNIEMPLVEEDFWMKVYSKILADFSFTAPQANTDSSSDETVSFEGEEVVE